MKLMKHLYGLVIMLACSLSLAAARQESPYAVAAHLPWQMNTAEMQMKKAQELGFAYIRSDFCWREFVKPDGTLDTQKFDALYSWSKKYSVRMLPLLGYESVRGIHPLDDPNGWLDFVTTLVKRYGEYWPAYEIWNEPNSPFFWKRDPSAWDYARLLEVTYKAIHEIKPDATVVFGGLAGVPVSFLNEALEAGAGEYCDALAVHPYATEPEEAAAKIDDAREALKAHGVGDKPVWVTEMGYPTSQKEDVFRKYLQAAFNEIGLGDASGFKAGTLVKIAPVTKDLLPPFKSLDRIPYDKLGSLSIKEYPVLFAAFGEQFPMVHFPALLDYVKKGGTAIFTGNAPLFYDSSAGDDAYDPTDGTQLPALHMYLNVWWGQKKGFPKMTVKSLVAPRFQSQFSIGENEMNAGHFLGDEMLKGNDRMIPLVYGVEGDRRFPVAALYKLDSDLKGNVIVSTAKSTITPCDEDLQASKIVRQYIVLLAKGVQRIFNYSLYSSGTSASDPESHFGLLRSDYSAKPACTAMQNLIRLCPPGSKMNHDLKNLRDDIWTASWLRPDGTTVTAMWTPYSARTATVLYPSASPDMIVDMYGKEQRPGENGEQEFTLSSNVTYFIGAEKVNLK